MPVSKKRKNAVNKPRKVVPLTVQKTERWAASLNGSRLMYLRNDPDFLTIIKMGRATNAVSYALTNVIREDGKTVASTRQFRRGSFVLAGYLHEGINVVRSIKGRYLTHPKFEPLRALALAAEYKRDRDYIRTIRNVVAFHLDEVDETTRHALGKLKPSTLPFMAGDDRMFMTFYFEFSDYLDVSYLVEKFGDGRSWEETAQDIVNSIMKFSEKFLIAAHEFQMDLCDKVKISEHVYRGPAAR